MLLIDADVVAHRSAYATLESDLDVTFEKIDEIMDFLVGKNLFKPDKSLVRSFLSGKSNFRKDLDPEYKANRKSSSKPDSLPDCMGYLIEEYGASVSEGQEADDDIAIMAASLDYKCTIASIDKDFLQIPCRHFNFYHNHSSVVSEFEGLHFFYKQILTGDRADNVKGLYRVGEVKASKMLDGCKTEEELFDVTLRAYEGDLEQVTLTGRLLWLRRKEGELWEPPVR